MFRALRILVVAFVACSREDARPQTKAEDAPSRAASTSTAVVVIDAKHNRGANPEADKYFVAAGASVVLDGSGYPLSFPPGGPAVSIIHMATAGGQYSAPWNGESRVTLSAANVVADPGSPPFKAFEAGREYAIGVGADVARDGGKDFLVLWAADLQAEAR